MSVNFTSKNQERLAQAFKSDPSEYLLVSSDRKKDNCACGQHISVRFHVEHPTTKHRLVLGCDCIETYAFLGSLKGQLEAFREAEKARKREAKDAELQAELDALVARFEARKAEIREATDGEWDYRAYVWTIGKKGLKLSALKSLKGKIRKANSVLAEIELDLAEVRKTAERRKRWQQNTQHSDISAS